MLHVNNAALREPDRIADVHSKEENPPKMNLVIPEAVQKLFWIGLALLATIPYDQHAAKPCLS